MRRIAVASLLTAALIGSAPAVADYFHGQISLRRGDPQEAYRDFREAAEKGDAESARALGFMLGRGLEFKGGGSIEARPAEAAKWYRIGADLGDKICADVLGAMLAAGRGVERNSKEALVRFEQAGRNVGAYRSSVTGIADDERDEIAAWHLALRSVMQRELKRPRALGPSGTVLLVFESNPVGVRVDSTADPRIVEFVRDFGREALELSPPPPAATRHKVVSEMEFVFN